MTDKEKALKGYTDEELINELKYRWFEAGIDYAIRQIEEKFGDDKK